MATLIKKYIYQVYGSDGTYKGQLNNIINDFGYDQTINSGGSQLEVILGNSFDDVGAVQTDDYWIDESSNKIVDESGNYIVWDKIFEFNNIPIDLGNRVRVSLTYDGSPSGVTVFDGFISKWSSSYTENTITLTILGWGAQLDNYVINTDPTGQTISQIVYDKTYRLGTPSGSPLGTQTPLAQSFNLASSTVVGGFTVYGYMPSGTVAYLRWKLYSNIPSAPGSLLDSGEVKMSNTSVQAIDISLTLAQTLAAGNYYLEFRAPYGMQYGGGEQYDFPYIEATSTNPYAGGSVYTGTVSGANTTWSAVAADDLAFVITSTSGGSNLTFTDNDPGTIIMRLLDQLASQGGKVTYTSDTVDLAGTIVTYNYKLQTILEGVNKMLSLSPDGFYWYIDPGTNYLHFHRVEDTADHTFILGKHISSLDIAYTLEQVANTIYFSGGDDGSGENVFVAAKDSSSAAQFGQWLVRLSDNRITDEETANVAAIGELTAKSNPLFQTTVEILAADYDIETIELGHMIALRNFNNLIDTLLFEVVSKKQFPDKISLQLGTLPPEQTKEVDSLKRRLDALESLNNPDAPS